MSWREGDWTDTMQVCENGHLITRYADSQPHSRKKRCPTRKYLEQTVNQANGCYDACSVMVRKLVEVLIIAVFEAKGEAAAIKKDDNFLMLSGLVDAILARSDWNLGRETKTALPLLKSLGDRAAHSRHYMARKVDVDKVLPGLRVAVEDLLHHANLVKEDTSHEG
jgi:hypothetical protein